MKGPIAIVSDLHANLPAWLAVRAALRSRGVETVWCLGDVVGYGPYVCALLGELHHFASGMEWQAVAGNHERALLACKASPGAATDEAYHFDAQRAIALQARELDGRQDLLAWIASWPSIIRPRSHVVLSHPDGRFEGLFMGSEPPRSGWDIDGDFERVRCDAGTRTLVFTGHTHVPCCHMRDEAGRWQSASPTGTVWLGGRSAWINPGSVGASRVRGDGRAFYAIYWPGESDEERVEFAAVEYDIDSVRIAARSGGYPVQAAWLAGNGR